jgi:hypothetical protein
VLGCERLLDLDAAAMAVHVAEAANVHEDVEAELLAGAEGAQHLVVASAMAQAGSDDFLAPSFRNVHNDAANLAVRIRTMLVEQCGYEFDV